MPGDNFSEWTSTAIQECRVFLIILSEISMKSRHCLTELGIAFSFYHEGELSILPVLIDNAHLPHDVEYYLAMLQYIKVPDLITDSAFLDEVAERVQKLLKSP